MTIPNPAKIASAAGIKKDTSAVPVFGNSCLVLDEFFTSS